MFVRLCFTPLILVCRQQESYVYELQMSGCLLLKLTLGNGENTINFTTVENIL